MRIADHEETDDARSPEDRIDGVGTAGVGTSGALEHGERATGAESAHRVAGG